jgi:hypothetical protein
MEIDVKRRALLQRAIGFLVAVGCSVWRPAVAIAPEKYGDARDFLTSFLGDDQLYPSETGTLERAEVEILYQIYQLLLRFHGFKVSNQFLISPDEFARFLNLKSIRKPSYYSEYLNAIQVWNNIKDLLAFPKRKQNQEDAAAIHEIRLSERATRIGSPFYHVNRYVLREMLALHITNGGFREFFIGESIAKNSYGHISRWFLHPNIPFRTWTGRDS